MPLRFCKTRWTENVPVVERALDMLPQLRQYIKAVNKSKVPDPQTRTFGVVKEMCGDQLIEAKLEKDIEALSKSADSFASQAEQKCDLTLIAKSNSMRKSAKEKANELETLKKLLDDKQQALLQ